MEIGSWWERIDIFKLFIITVRSSIVRRINTTLVALSDQDFIEKCGQCTGFLFLILLFKFCFLPNPCFSTFLSKQNVSGPKSV